MRRIVSICFTFTLALAAVVALAQLPEPVMNPTPTCTKVTVDASALKAAAGTQDVTLFTLPARAKLTVLNTKQSVAFAGTHIGAATFTGTGLDDAVIAGTFSGANALNYRVAIDGEGTPDTFKWSDDGGSTWDATTVAITGAPQALNNGVTVTFAATTGHTANDRWDFATTVLSAMTATVGTAGATDAYSAAHNIFAAPSATAFKDTDKLNGGFSASMDAHAVVARFTATGQNLGDTTNSFLGAGSVDFRACYLVLP